MLKNTYIKFEAIQDIKKLVLKKYINKHNEIYTLDQS